MAVSRSRSARASRKRARRMRRVEHDLTDEQWQAMLGLWTGCAYCGASDVAMQRDCVLAISRGGRYTLDNVVPACRSCNASKCNDEVTGWLRRTRRDERAFLIRLAEVQRTLRLRFVEPDSELDTELDDEPDPELADESEIGPGAGSEPAADPGAGGVPAPGGDVAPRVG